MNNIMQEQLRELYLADLALPSTFDGSKKVRHLNHWKDINTIIRNGNSPRIIDPHGTTDIWLWSDIHWGHTNIIKYANRPYPNSRLMNECLIGNYLNTVKPQDICIFGGDIGFMKECDINHILNQLPGYKIQIVGNHDMYRNGTLYELAFDETHLCMTIDVPDHDLDVQLLITHYPMDNVPDGCVNVHGHIHTHLADTWNLNMCVEHTNYKPMHLKEFITRARKYVGTQKGIIV